jgi:hypothetical protein
LGFIGRPGARIHDGVLMQRERHAPDHAAIELAAHHAGIDDPSGGERADHAGRADLAEIRIDLDLGEHGPMRMHGVGRIARPDRPRWFPGPSISRSPARAEDIGVALAAALVVAAEQAARARDHAGIAGAEQRRAIVAGREIGKPRDHVGAGVVNRHAGGRGVGRAAGDAASGRSEVPDLNSTCSMSSPSPSAAICASAVQAP